MNVIEYIDREIGKFRRGETTTNNIIEITKEQYKELQSYVRMNLLPYEHAIKYQEKFGYVLDYNGFGLKMIIDKKE
jgi:hypothetical protein